MAKKQRVSDSIQAKFDKPLFKLGDAVFFSWLGQKKYGHVIRFKKTNWGIQYMVQTKAGMRYPCGIQLGEYRTEYAVGCIFFEETRTIGTEEITRRIAQDTDTRRIATVSPNTTGKKDESRVLDTTSGGNDDAINRKKSATRKHTNSRKDDDKSSTKRVPANNSGKRKNPKTELNNAIAKQRDFLNGFVKRD